MAILVLLAGAAVIHAQDVVPATNEPSLNYPGGTQNPTGPVVELNPPNESVERAGQSYSAQARRFQYGLLLRVRGIYDDNINISQFNPISDFYFVIEPTITLGLGDIFERTENYIRFDYTPSVFLFLDHSENDAVQHLIHLEGHHRFGRLDLTLVQDIQILDGDALVLGN